MDCFLGGWVIVEVDNWGKFVEMHIDHQLWCVSFEQCGSENQGFVVEVSLEEQHFLQSTNILLQIYCTLVHRMTYLQLVFYHFESGVAQVSQMGEIDCLMSDKFIPELIQYLKFKLGRVSHLKFDLTLMGQHQQSGLISWQQHAAHSAFHSIYPAQHLPDLHHKAYWRVIPSQPGHPIPCN